MQNQTPGAAGEKVLLTTAGSRVGVAVSSGTQIFCPERAAGVVLCGGTTQWQDAAAAAALQAGTPVLAADTNFEGAIDCTSRGAAWTLTVSTAPELTELRERVMLTTPRPAPAVTRASGSRTGLPVSEQHPGVTELTGSAAAVVLQTLLRRYRAGQSGPRSYLGGNTALAAPDAAAMVRVCAETGAGVTIAADAAPATATVSGAGQQPNSWVAATIAELHRRTVATGATPRVCVVTDRAAFTCAAAAAAELELAESSLLQPGGVEAGDVEAEGVEPEGGVSQCALIGAIDSVARRVPTGWQDPGENLYLLGVTRSEFTSDGAALLPKDVHLPGGGVAPEVDFGSELALGRLVHSAALGGIISGAVPLLGDGLAGAVVRGCARFGVGARIWLRELCGRDGVSVATALLSGSGARMLVSVPREEDVKFRGLCDGRGYPVLRLGVTDTTGVSAAVEVQDVCTVTLHTRS